MKVNAMTGELLFLFASIVILTFVLSHLIKQWLFDIRFYRANGWDYTKDSGNRSYPAGNVRIRGMAAIPNRERVLIAYPCMIFGQLLLLIGFAVITWEIVHG